MHIDGYNAWQYKMSSFLWVTLKSFRNILVKIRGSVGKARARHRGSGWIVIVTISFFIVVPISRQARKSHGRPPTLPQMIHGSQASQGQLKWPAQCSSTLLATRTARRCPFKRQMTVTGTDLLRLRSPEQRTDWARLEGMKTPSRRAVPRALLPFNTWRPLFSSKGLKQQCHVDYHWTAVPPTPIKVASAWNRTSCDSGSLSPRQFKSDGAWETLADIYSNTHNALNINLMVLSFCKRASTLSPEGPFFSHVLSRQYTDFNSFMLACCLQDEHQFAWSGI